MDTPTRTLSGQFQLTCILSDKRQIALTGYLYSDEPADQYNKRIDEFQDAIDRQAIRADVFSKEAEIARNVVGMEALAAHYEDLDKRKKLGRKLTSQEIQQIEKYDSSVDFLKRSNDSLRAAINEGKRKLNGAA